jgi:hypothetical protein
MANPVSVAANYFPKIHHRRFESEEARKNEISRIVGKDVDAKMFSKKSFQIF